MMQSVSSLFFRIFYFARAVMMTLFAVLLAVPAAVILAALLAVVFVLLWFGLVVLLFVLLVALLLARRRAVEWAKWAGRQGPWRSGWTGWSSMFFLILTGSLLSLALLPSTARADWLLRGGAEAYVSGTTRLNIGDSTTTIKNNTGGGFNVATGLRLFKSIDLTAEYVFLHHRANVSAYSGLPLFSDNSVRNFAINHHMVLANADYRFGRLFGLGDFGIALGSGIGFDVVGAGFDGVAGREGFSVVKVVIPFRVAIDYQLNELLALGIYGRYYLMPDSRGSLTAATMFGGSAVNVANLSMLSIGGFLNLSF